MTLKLDLRPEGPYLHVCATGERTMDNIALIAKQVMSTCLKHQLNAVLVDIRDLEGRISIFDAFMIPASLFPSLEQFGIIKRVAILDARERSERAAFFESVSQKGGYNIRAFLELEPAIAWLIDNSGSDPDE